MLLTDNNKTIKCWKTSIPRLILSNNHVDTISIGSTHAVFSTNNILFAIGNNDCGQLALGYQQKNNSGIPIVVYNSKYHKDGPELGYQVEKTAIAIKLGRSDVSSFCCKDKMTTFIISHHNDDNNGYLRQKYGLVEVIEQRNMDVSGWSDFQIYLWLDRMQKNGSLLSVGDYIGQRLSITIKETSCYHMPHIEYVYSDWRSSRPNTCCFAGLNAMAVCQGNVASLFST